MKKIIAILLAVTMLASMATVVSAAETTKTTTLTTEVPAATYTLNIPADQEIPFGATSTDIGNVTVTDASGFAEGKNLQVTVDYDSFSSQDVATTIPFTLRFHNGLNADMYFDVASGDTVRFLGQTDGTTLDEILVDDANSTHRINQVLLRINSEDWGKALAGEYTATITFTCEVVVEE